MSIYKDCDIRGIYPREIDEQAVYTVGRALGTLHPGAKVAVGGDLRLSTPALKGELIRGLTESGARVFDLGIIPTPALYWALSRLPLDGGATVTASHNPPQYNGVKFMFDGEPVTRKIMDRVEAVARSGRFSEAAGSCRNCEVLDDYMDSLTGRFHARRPLRILVDAGNGAMSEVAPKVLRRCGYEVVELFCQPDGRFPNRDPNPAEYRHLTAACQAVVDHGADFAVAFDGDGDRAVFIDDRGRPVVNEKALTLFVQRLLKDRPTPVVYDQKASSIVKRATLALGGEPVPERSGHAFIKRHFLRVGAAIAGEVSGHFFFGELGYDDALFAALTMADLLSESAEPLSALTDAIHCPPITPDLRVRCPYDQQQSWLDRMEALGTARGGQASHLDGVRLDFPEGWLLMRKSITAEQITLRVEADTPVALDALLGMVAEALPEAGEALQSWRSNPC
ncbi:MAG: phosphomannomutase/phosphoglucomutase [Clostridia bacterium]|nr:phosphomannomutase/phosphoglucomutase [Clostridia bacterium]